VPLFVEELTKAVVESGMLTDAGDRDTAVGRPAPIAWSRSTPRESAISSGDCRQQTLPAVGESGHKWHSALAGHQKRSTSTANT
jgi:hypothetical protein